jgi:putative ABC transport system permease protein
MTSNLPLRPNQGTWAVSGDPAVQLSMSSASAQHDAVSPDYLERMGIPLLAGRWLSAGDAAGSERVAIVNEVMARDFWPNVSAVGRQFLAPNGGVRRVVGVVADTRSADLGKEPLATFFESLDQLMASRLSLVFGTTGDPASVIAAASRTARGVDPSAVIGEASSMTDIVSASLMGERYRTRLMGFFAAAALLICALGIGGLASRAVSARLRELCVRMAVGADARGLMRLVVGEYLVVVAVGAVAGGLLSIAASRVVTRYLYGVSGGDPLTFTATAIALMLTGALAAWLPIRGIGRVSLARQLLSE